MASITIMLRARKAGLIEHSVPYLCRRGTPDLGTMRQWRIKFMDFQIWLVILKEVNLLVKDYPGVGKSVQS
jgi:hypothetical protein